MELAEKAWIVDVLQASDVIDSMLIAEGASNERTLVLRIRLSMVEVLLGIMKESPSVASDTLVMVVLIKVDVNISAVVHISTVFKVMKNT